MGQKESDAEITWESQEREGGDRDSTGNPSANAGLRGLTQAEVEQRVEEGKTNAVKESTSRSLASIIRANVFNRFNAILGTLLVVILIFGSPKDALFGGVLVVNTLIGIIQELRAKLTLDRLSLLSAPKARVIRDGLPQEIPTGEVVLDDLLELRMGDQVIADGTVLQSQGLEIDESLLTGESIPIRKESGDQVYSGSFVVAGTGIYQATGVGADSYARKLAAEARRFTLVKSDLRDAINTLLRYVTYVMIPASIILLASQLGADNSLGSALTGTVAGVVAMVPEGLVLLTSMAFAVSAITLARRNVLVQELPAVEGLARVDVVCLDKTGTLTDGNLTLSAVEALGPEEGIAEALGALGAETSTRNATLEAIAQAYPPPQDWEEVGGVPFSSARKWSAKSFSGKGTWLLGAPEVLLGNDFPGSELEKRVDRLTGSGARVLLLAHATEMLETEELPGKLYPRALVIMEEKVRTDAAETLHYFREQSVSLKIISGDNPNTVLKVASRAGVENAGKPVDARYLPQDQEALAAVMDKSTVFGRVNPEQKREMVKALQSRGHVVAMTGDGVNDALALKDADLGIAMGSGSPATKAVAQLVLLDGRFSTLPGVVQEGRRVMANMERVANLFVTKTVYAMILAVAIGIAGWPFIFLPRHLTLIGSLTIGIPAFFLSFAPTKKLYRPGLLTRVLRFAIPAGTVMAIATFLTTLLSRSLGISVEESRTVSLLVLISVGFWVLVLLSRPLFTWRGILVLGMVGVLGLVLAVPYFRKFFEIDLPTLPVSLMVLAIAVVAVLLLHLIYKLLNIFYHFKKESHSLEGRSEKRAGNGSRED